MHQSKLDTQFQTKDPSRKNEEQKGIKKFWKTQNTGYFQDNRNVYRMQGSFQKKNMSGKIMESKVQVSNTMYTVPLSEKALFLDKIDSKQNV